VWVAVRARRGVDEADQRTRGAQGDRCGKPGRCEGKMDKERGRAVFMFGESGERLRLRALPDRGDAKPGWANT